MKFFVSVLQVKGENGKNPCSGNCVHSGFNLIICDVKTGLMVQDVSTNANDIPSWNEYSEQNVETLFEFAEMFSHKDGCIFIMVPDVPVIKSDIATYANRYNFVVYREWAVFNELPFACFFDLRLKVFFYHYLAYLCFIS